MKLKIIIPTVLLAIVLAISFFVLPHKNVQVAEQQNENTILYYGNGCPHCAIVDKYISDNGVAAKISFSQKEVYGNKNNRDELISKAQGCGLDTAAIGIPLLWDNGKCYVGDEEIINYFKTAINEEP